MNNKYCFLVILLVIYHTKAVAQYGAPVFIQSFGEGTQNPGLIGSPLAAGITDFSYSTDWCPSPGSYTIARRIHINGCFDDEWIPLRKDASPGSDLGMMMIINNSTGPDRLVYKDTVTKSFCAGTTYRFSVAVINLDKPSNCISGQDFASFELRLENELGQLIERDTSMRIGYAPLVQDQYIYTEFGFDFTLPIPLNKLIAKLTLLNNTYRCAEDFAIDDIQIRPKGPGVSIKFEGEPEGTFVKAVCFQDNKWVSFSGAVGGPFYMNTALQWQQSTDFGLTWTDIPGATDYSYSRLLSTPDTFLFRLTAGEAVNMSNPNCRVVSNAYRVEVDGIPSNYTISNNSPVCSGHDLKLLGEGAASYIWTGPNGFYDNIPYAHIFFSTLADSGMYYVELTSFGGCKVTDSTYVTVIGTDVHADPDTAICKGGSVRLRSSAGLTHIWTPSVGLSGANSRSPLARPETTTEYTVTVTDTTGCSDTAKALVRVLNNIELKASIQGTNDLCGAYDSASFRDISTGVVADREWIFGNGQIDTIRNPPIQYYYTANEPGFLVQLAIKDTAGCTDTAYHRVYVQNNCYIAVPTAFTPNGDGLNDDLGPLNPYKATNLLFRIYSRTGQMVFETRDWTKRWNGNIGNAKQAGGVYVWILEYNDASNKRVLIKGTSVLIR